MNSIASSASRFRIASRREMGWGQSVLLVLLSGVASVGAATLHGLFADNMVLQRDLPITVYGAGDAGETVTVELGGKTASAVVAEGR